MNKKGIILLEFLLTLTLMGILITPVLMTLHSIRHTTDNLQTQIKIQNQLGFVDIWLKNLLLEVELVTEINGVVPLEFIKKNGNKVILELKDGFLRKREYGLISTGNYKLRPHYAKPLTYFPITELGIKQLDENTLSVTLKNEKAEHTFIKQIGHE